MGDEERRLLKVLSSSVNLDILRLLGTKPSYPRELARLLGRDETDVSRRLRLLERLGLVEGVWESVSGRNIRLYRSLVDRVFIDFRSGRIELYSGDRVVGSLASDVVLDGVGGSPRFFVGRDREVSLIRDSGRPLIVVYGLSGVGKTSLVRRALEGLDDVLWFDLTGLETPEYVLWRIGLFLSSRGYPGLLEHLGSSYRDVRVGLDLAVSYLGRVGGVLVFDDYHLVEGGVLEGFLQFIFRNAGGYRVVVVSRKRPRGLPCGSVLDCELVLLEGLSIGEVRELFGLRGVVVDDDFIVDVYSSTLGHPLLVNMVLNLVSLGGRVRVRDSDVLSSLVRDVLGVLSDRERRVLFFASFFDEPVEAGLIEAVSGVGGAGDVLERLVDRALVERVGGGYRVHGLVRRFFERGDAWRVFSAAGDYFSMRGGWLNRIRAMRYYLRAGACGRAVDLVVERMRRDDRGYMFVLGDYLGVVEGLLGCPGLDLAGRGYLLAEKGVLLFLRGDVEGSYECFDRALGIGVELGDEFLRVFSGVYLVNLLVMKGSVDEALDLAGDVVDSARVLGDDFLLFGALSNYMYALSGKGLLDEALSVAGLVREVAGRLGDPFYVVWSLVYESEVKRLMGRVGEALVSFEEVFELSGRLGLLLPRAVVAMVLGSIYKDLGRFDDAERMLGVSLDAFRSMGVYVKLLEVDSVRVEMYLGLGRVEEALRVLYDMLGEVEKRGLGRYYPYVLATLAYALVLAGRSGEAVGFVDRLCGLGSCFPEACSRIRELLELSPDIDVNGCLRGLLSGFDS